MAQLPVQLTIGQLAERSGMSHSALRFYEAKGLIRAERTAGNQRRYHRSTLRRLAFIAAAQRVGLTLARIQEALATLPEERAPTAEDWARLSRMWRDEDALAAWGPGAPLLRPAREGGL